MADKKISQLTAASTPLAGTEVLPIVQSGSTVKVSVADLTAGRTVSALRAKIGAGAASNTSPLMVNTPSGTAAGVQLFQDGIESWIIGMDASDGALKYKNSGSLKWSIGTAGNATLALGNLVVGTATKGIDFSANTGAAGMTSELLNWYEEGTWTPTDASGASLTFTSATGRYTRVGNVVFLFGFVQYPVTASGANASIGGLPFTVNSNSSALQGAVTYSQVATVRSIGVNPSTTNTTVYTFAGVAVTNATLSGTVLYFNSTYFV